MKAEIIMDAERPVLILHPENGAEKVLLSLVGSAEYWGRHKKNDGTIIMKVNFKK